MSFSLCRHGLLIGLALLTCSGAKTTTTPDCTSTSCLSQLPVADEVGLLHVQSSVVSGKDRKKPLRTVPDDRGDPMVDIDEDDSVIAGDPDSEFSDRASILSGLSRLFVSDFSVPSAEPKPDPPANVQGFNGMYCERRFGGLLNHHKKDGNHGPEILNTATSVFILFTGMYQLIFWNHQSAFIRLLCALVVINGWSSVLRHLLDNSFCAALDGMSLVVGAVLGCCFMLDLAAQRARSWFTTAALRMAVWGGMPILFCLCIVRNPHTFDPHTSSMAFRVMFALPLMCVAVAVYGSLWGNWVTWTNVDDEAIGIVKNYLMVGIPLCCIGAACIGLSELLCETSPIAQYFPGHALWHMLFPLGVNALLLFVCALWSDTKQQPMAFHKGDGWKARWYAFAPSFDSRIRSLH